MTEYTFENYGTAQFWLNGWYTIGELEHVLAELKEIKERQDVAMVQNMKESGMMK